MWLLLVPVLVLSISPQRCRAFQCSTLPYSDQISEYFVCPSDGRTEHYHNDVTNTEDCDYSSTLDLTLCDISEKTSPATLCWRLRDSATGTVEVTFPLLPQRCNFTGYDITLMVHETVQCPFSLDDFSKHSKKEVAIRDCLEPSCMNQCSQRGLVVFRHVFSACYQLYLTPKRHLQAYQELVSTSVPILTQYIKTPISTTQSPIVQLKQNPTDLSMQAQFPMSPASSHITLSYGINTSVGEHACRNTGVPLITCTSCLGSPEIQCKSGGSESITPTCSYQGESVVRCKFSGLKPGNYCVRIQFDDDRCVADTIWNDNNNYSTCTWEVFQQFLSDGQVMEVGPLHSSTVSPALLVFLLIAIIAACALTGYVVYRHMLPSNPHFLPVRHKSLQITERPTVLLLYARDCPSFMQAVVQLRTHLRRVYNCQVLDCWEDSQYGNVAQNPDRWLKSLLNNTRVRTVLVTSPASVVQEAALIHNSAVQYLQPKAFDTVLTHALSLLHDTNTNDPYKRLFVVRLDTGAEGVLPHARTYLNPNTTYVLPVHLNKLVAALYNLDSTLCTITTDSQTDLTMLSETISEYQQYLRDNPRYLDSLLIAETETSVHHVPT